MTTHKTCGRRRLTVLLCVLLLFCTALAPPAFAAGVTVSTKSSTAYFQTYASTSTWVDIGTPQHVINETGKVAYCLQTSLNSPSNSGYSSANWSDFYDQTTLTGLRAILEHGYPASNGGFTDDQARYATANAIRFWLAERGCEGVPSWMNYSAYSYIFRAKSGYEDLFNWCIALLTLARNQSVYTHSLSLSSSSVTLTQNGNTFTGSVNVYLNNCKQDAYGEPLAGAVFELEASMDGQSWESVSQKTSDETGIVRFEGLDAKTVREAKADTGKNNGLTNDITDGYAASASASAGDVVDYQIISTLPTITSQASFLSQYTFVDQLSKGITYNKNDVKIEFFKGAACTEPVAAWDEASGKFAVSYSELSTGQKMTIAMTEAGLAEINTSEAVYGTDSLNRGYSDCTLRITYSCTLNSDAKLVYGDSGNPNAVTLTWSRTNTEYTDTLDSDAHVYSYGIDMTKKFSDGAGSFENVKFILRNDTDGYYVTAKLLGGVYYVTGHVSAESQATVFVPGSDGKVILRGLEDDTYVATELETDEGYNLLKSSITVVISAVEGEACPDCHRPLLTASATVNDKAVEMKEDNGSVHAAVPFTVINTKGFELPKTGSYGTWMFTVCGVLSMGAAAFILFKLSRKKKSM